MTPLEKLDGLDATRRRAFLGLFGGARLNVTAFADPDGVERTPHFGKAECEWVKDWRDFYEHELPALGFTTFQQSDPKPALGARAGSTYRDVLIGITDEGFAAQASYWERVNR